MKTLNVLKPLSCLFFLLGTCLPTQSYLLDQKYALPIVAICSLTVSFLLKLVMHYMKRLSLKELARMQLAMIVPYSIMASYLLVFIYLLPESEIENADTILGLIIYYTIAVVFACSLISHFSKNTSNLEFYSYTVGMLGMMVWKSVLTINQIYNFNTQLNSLDYDATSYMALHDEENEEIAEEGLRIENEKDVYILALVIYITVVFIILDIIGRPFEKMEKERELILKEQLGLQESDLSDSEDENDKGDENENEGNPQKDGNQPNEGKQEKEMSSLQKQKSEGVDSEHIEPSERMHFDPGNDTGNSAGGDQQ